MANERANAYAVCCHLTLGMFFDMPKDFPYDKTPALQRHEFDLQRPRSISLA